MQPRAASLHYHYLTPDKLGNIDQFPKEGDDGVERISLLVVKSELAPLVNTVVSVVRKEELVPYSNVVAYRS